MQDSHREAHDAFLTLRHKEAKPTPFPSVHLLFATNSNVSIATGEILILDVEDVLSELDKDSPLVVSLLEQMRNYDCRRQAVLGIVFDRKTVLSEVVRCDPSDWIP